MSKTRNENMSLNSFKFFILNLSETIHFNHISQPLKQYTQFFTNFFFHFTFEIVIVMIAETSFPRAVLAVKSFVKTLF